MERKIGEIFEVNGRKYRVEECGAEKLFCEGCVFDNGETCGKPMVKHWEEFLCGAEARTDHKQVIFREVQEAETTDKPSLTEKEPADKPSLTEKEPADKPSLATNRLEYAIGEIFERDGVKYQCAAEREDESCADCAFFDFECSNYVCQFGSRKDKTHAIFKKVGEKANPESEIEKRRMAAEDFEFFVREFAPEALSLYRAMVRWQPFTAGKKCVMPQPRRNDRAATDIIETTARKINSLAEGELQAPDGQRAQNAFDRISELAGEIIKMCGDFKKE